MIKAIETHYAGCRFRSRLEARWAVFLEHMHIEWQYEAQGFECGPRVSLTTGSEAWPTWGYLPDFWLPEQKTFIEVKGSLTDGEWLRVIDNASSLCDRTDTRLALCGPIPEPGSEWAPTALSMRKGCVLVSPALVGGATDDGEHSLGEGCIAHDTGGDLWAVTAEACNREAALRNFGRNPLGYPLRWREAFGSFNRAYAVARSARFEHGERG